MKIELICEYCGGKRFINRASSHSWKRKSKTYECKKCGSWIIIERDEGLRK